MGEVAREGRTILFVSHNMTALLNLCPRAILLRKGQLVRDEQTAEVVNDYLASGLAENIFDPLAGDQVGDGRAGIADFIVRPNPPRTGAPVEFIFCIERPPVDGAVSPLIAELAISFLSEQGNPLFQIFSRHMGIEFEFWPGRSRSVVKLDALPLAPGRYLLNLWLGAGATPIDWRREGFVLHVEAGRLAGGEYVETRGYPVLVPARWQQVNGASEVV
jgi:lipopolysaccharide transport system ATP-binding protein